MAGLSDMEELLGTVVERDIRDYLREAMVCYGAGAYRGCVVLVHTALFEGLRTRLLALAPVNAVAKSVSQEIEPLASNQKVFELLMVQKMKAAAIITQLEADILEQLNKQRNKAAHPSGHKVLAEEARFVFSEAIQKFLSKPIRQTSVLVQSILDRLSGPNFFPGSQVPDMQLIVDQETENLDAAAYPQLIVKLVEAVEGTDATTIRNAQFFLIALASKKDPTIRGLLTKYFFDVKSANSNHANFASTLVSTDPHLLDDLKGGTRTRVLALLLVNANAVGLSGPYVELQNPAHLVAATIAQLGEAFMTINYGALVDWVISKAPQAPEFVAVIAQSPGLSDRLLDQFQARAASSQWDTSSYFAGGAPALDTPLGLNVTDARALTLLASVARGADWNGFAAMGLANGKFTTLPLLKRKAKAFATNSPADAQAAITSVGLNLTIADFEEKYLSDPAPVQDF